MPTFKTSNIATSKALIAVVFTFLPTIAMSSPWLEANNPFVRSSLALLSDAGQLSSPINHYPLRWSLLGGDLTQTRQSDDIVNEANQELRYTLNSAKLNRGNRLFKVLSGTQQSSLSSYGQFNEDEKGIYTSVEHLGSTFSYRLSAGYSEYQDDTTLNMDNSYIAMSTGAWLWYVGNIDRWWGQGWQHNLILGSYAKAAPDLSVSYIGESQGLGVWSLESIVAQPSHSDYGYHSATRLVSNPIRLFEYGVTYQRWLSDINSRQDDEQFALDAKLTLPRLSNLYHSVYAEAASTADIAELGAWVLGWTGSFPIGQNTARLVLESQRTTSAHDTTPWNGGHYPSMTDNVANTSYLLDNSASIAFYLQLQNDHQFSVSYQRSQLANEKANTSQATYNLPALAGMVRLGARYEQNENSNNDTSLWAGYEFRF